MNEAISNGFRRVGDVDLVRTLRCVRRYYPSSPPSFAFETLSFNIT